MNLYGEYSRICDFSRILSSLNFARNDLCATSDKNINFSISKKCYVKLGFHILYAVEQFSSLFSSQFSLMQSNCVQTLSNYHLFRKFR